MKCEDCGKNKKDVRKRKDYAQEEVYGNIVYYTVCADCHTDNCADV